MKFHVLVTATVDDNRYLFETSIDAVDETEVTAIMNQYQTYINGAEVTSYSNHIKAGKDIQVEYTILEETKYRDIMRYYKEDPTSLDIYKAAEFEFWYENIKFDENKETYVLINVDCDYTELSHSFTYAVVLKGTREDIESILQNYKRNIKNISVYSYYQNAIVSWKILTSQEYSLFEAARNIKKSFFDDHAYYFYNWLNEED